MKTQPDESNIPAIQRMLMHSLEFSRQKKETCRQIMLILIYPFDWRKIVAEAHSDDPDPDQT